MRIHSRIERLEDELLPLPAGTPLRLNIQAVDSEGKVVVAEVFEVPQAFPAGPAGEDIEASWERGSGDKERNAARRGPGGAQ